VSSVVELDEFAALVANLCVTVEEEADDCREAGRGEPNDDRECEEDYDDDDCTWHGSYRSGLNAQASISTAPPKGSDATPIVLRAGRELPNPATYAVLKVENVSMSVRKHNVFATSLMFAPTVAS
jgi:hypothetical protein